jgi:nucleoside-diphosphate-sugar epimerase
VYKLRSLNLSLNVGREAAKRGVKCFVELSTGMVYKPDSAPSKENDKLKPWSKIAVFKLQAEEDLAKIEGYVLTGHHRHNTRTETGRDLSTRQERH